MGIKRDEERMKTLNDFESNQEFVDYIKINEVAYYNDLLDYVVELNDDNEDPEITYTLDVVIDDSELFYRWYEVL